MHVALVSIGNCPSLALRNIRRYCLAHEDIRAAVTFELLDWDIRDFRDARAESSQQWSFVTRFDEAVDELARARPDVLAFSCYLWNVELSLHLAHLVKRLLPETWVVLGGPDAGPRAAELLRRYPAIDVVVEGDGEIPFLGLLRQLLSGASDLGRVPALRYRSGAEVAVNPAPSEPLDLSLLRGVYDQLPSQVELNRWYWPHLLYETLRGCPYSCSYCMYGKTPMNRKEVDTVVEELYGLLSRELQVEIIDPTFTTVKKRAKEILRRLGERDYSGRLYFEAYPDSIDEEMVELIAEARVSCIGIGFQTVSAAGLKAVRRPKNLERFERAVRLLQASGIHFYVDVIYGLPETTVADFLATIDYVYSLGVTKLVIYRLLGLPGSPMMDDVDRHGLVFSQSPPYELLSSATFSLADVIFCERFHRAYADLLGRLPAGELRRLAASAGGVSALVRLFMARGCEDAAAFREALAAEPESWMAPALAETRAGAATAAV